MASKPPDKPSRPAAPGADDALYRARRRRRSIALALVLGALVILFYILAAVKMLGQINVPRP